MRRGLATVCITLLFIPGGAFALQFRAPPAVSTMLDEIVAFFDDLFAPFLNVHYAASAEPASAAAASPTVPAQTPPTDTPSSQQGNAPTNLFTATSTGGAMPTVETAPPPERTVYLQPQTIERTVVQSAPLPNDVVHTSLLAGVLAALQSKINAQIAAITTPPPFPQQVAAGGNGVFTYGAAAAASSGSGGGGGSGGVSLDQVNSMIASAIQAVLRNRPSHCQYHYRHERQPCERDRDHTPRHGYCDA